MRSIVRLVIPVVLFTVSCSGNSQLPTAPSSIAGQRSADRHSITVNAADLPFTLGSVAPSLGNEINATFIAAMLDGVPASGGTSLPKLLRDAMEAVLGARVEAQAGFVRNCTRSGNATVRYSGPTSGGTATLSNTQVVFSGCTYAWSNRTVTFHATLRATGTFRASRPADPIHLEGDIQIDGIGGPFILNGDTGPFLNGTITPPPGQPQETVRIGAPDTSTPAPAPPGSTTPPGGSATVNVTGTWGADGQAALALIQNGSSLTGQFLLPDMSAIPGQFVLLENRLNGFVSGNEVNFTGTIIFRVGDSEGAITATMTSNATMRVTGSTLAGSIAQQMRADCSGFMVGFCLPPTDQTTSTSLTRMGSATVSGVHDVTGNWTGANRFRLQQDGGGNITGSVLAPDLAEQRVEGRNDNNRVTLRIRYVARENTSTVDYTRTTEHAYEVTVTDPSGMSGFLTTVSTERCVAKSSSAGSFCDARNKTERTAGNASLIKR
jgi:hypothetical protein